MILRPIKDSEYVGASRYTGYIDKTLKLTLECGHVIYRKASQGFGRRARCGACEHAKQSAPSPTGREPT